jgi:hypothetical protein
MNGVDMGVRGRVALGRSCPRLLLRVSLLRNGYLLGGRAAFVFLWFFRILCKGTFYCEVL